MAVAIDMCSIRVSLTINVEMECTLILYEKWDRYFQLGTHVNENENFKLRLRIMMPQLEPMFCKSVIIVPGYHTLRSKV